MAIFWVAIKKNPASVQIHMLYTCYYKIKETLWVCKFIFIYELTKTLNAFLIYKTCMKMGMKMLNCDINQYFYTSANIG